MCAQIGEDLTFDMSVLREILRVARDAAALLDFQRERTRRFWRRALHL